MRKITLAMVYMAITASVLSSIRPAFAQALAITDVTYAMKDSDVVVHYTLGGPADKSYKVQLVLKKEGDRNFEWFPKTVSGDIGTGDYAGKDREIVWHLYDENPYGFDGDGYYFEVSVTLLNAERGGSSWLYYLGGALVSGGAAAYYLLRGAHPGASQLPSPPLRP